VAGDGSARATVVLYCFGMQQGVINETGVVTYSALSNLELSSGTFDVFNQIDGGACLELM
jgi:hypothetical protein